MLTRVSKRLLSGADIVDNLTSESCVSNLSVMELGDETTVGSADQAGLASARGKQ